MLDMMKYWVWLSKLANIGDRRGKQLLEVFGGPYEVWNAREWELKALEFMTEHLVDNLLDNKARKNADTIVDDILRRGIDIVSIDRDEYPPNLRYITDPPLVIFRRGQKPTGSERYVAVVGSRHPSAYGCAVTRSLVRDLTLAGYTIVSGMAMGIDTVAHESALNADGRTIAILACGPERAYPASNRRLAERVREQGAIYSEHLPGTPPMQQFFPWRNRIISGFSAAVLVTEAAKRSGALITAGYAGDQGRDVFAVPGNITSPLSQGTNALIRDGAIPVTSVKDIVDALNPYLLDGQVHLAQQSLASGGFEAHSTGRVGIGKEHSRVTGVLSPNLKRLPENELRIVKLLNEKGSMTVDSIIKACGGTTGQITSTLVLMELKGLLRSLSGSVYEISRIV